MRNILRCVYSFVYSIPYACTHTHWELCIFLACFIWTHSYYLFVNTVFADKKVWVIFDRWKYEYFQLDYCCCYCRSHCFNFLIQSFVVLLKMCHKTIKPHTYTHTAEKGNWKKYGSWKVWEQREVNQMEWKNIPESTSVKCKHFV